MIGVPENEVPVNEVDVLESQGGPLANLIHKILINKEDGKEEFAYFVEGTRDLTSLIVTNDKVFAIRKLQLPRGTIRTPDSYLKNPDFIKAILKDQEYRKASNVGSDGDTFIQLSDLMGANLEITAHQPGDIDIKKHLEDVNSNRQANSNPFVPVK